MDYEEKNIAPKRVSQDRVFDNDITDGLAKVILGRNNINKQQQKLKDKNLEFDV
jgi:hypothetical protein